LASEKTDKRRKKDKGKECDTFIYAAYLPPGLHQFVIYCPHTKRAFCKDLIVDLNHIDPYPEFPKNKHYFRPDEPNAKPKKTRCNVWRKWRHDTPEDL